MFGQNNMLTRLVLIGLPQWKVLSSHQRDLVWVRLVCPMLNRWQLLITKIGILSPVIYYLSYNFGLPPFSWSNLFIWMFALIILPDLVDITFLAFCQKRITKWIMDNDAEIQTTA